MTAKTLLVADDDANIIAALHMLFKAHGFEVSAVTTPDALLEQVKTREFSAALIDLNYQKDTTSGQEGLDLIGQIKAIDDALPIIAMTGYSSVQIAVDAMKLGAADFVQKPWTNERLLHTVNTQIRLKEAKNTGQKLAQENALLKSQITAQTDALIADSEAMQQLIAQLDKLAQSDMSILLTGENGTGKSLLAEYIHKRSMRQNESFIAVNMGAISESLFESEMFGHVKGAFTDAKENRIGRFELAQAGTIFLDEIANISTPQQAKLLRVLEERQFERVGSSKTLHIDVRLISATNADIQAMVNDASFRQDLLYRLNTVTIRVPALRERQSDIHKLAQHTIQVCAKKYQLPEKALSPDALQQLKAYHWPGNIRELNHVIERAMFLSTQDVIESRDLALEPQVNTVATTGEERFDTMTLEAIEKAVIVKRQRDANLSSTQVAESLGLSRSAYYRRLEKLNLTE